MKNISLYFIYLFILQIIKLNNEPFNQLKTVSSILKMGHYIRRIIEFKYIYVALLSLVVIIIVIIELFLFCRTVMFDLIFINLF